MKQIIILALISCTISCAKFKEDFLNVRRDSRIKIPSSIADYQGMLDNGSNNIESDAWFNINMSAFVGMLAGDEFYFTQQTLLDVSASYYYFDRNVYLWEDDIYLPDHNLNLDDWFKAYKRIYYCNMALVGIADINPTDAEKAAWNNVKGTALFYRALALYELAQEYCKQYDSTTAKNDLGLVLRISNDVTMKFPRSNLYDTYQMMLNDLETSLSLLPDRTEITFRPCKATVYGLLARVCQIMGRHGEAGMYANEAIDIWPELTDYNTLQKGNPYLFPFDIGASNPEVMFFTHTNPPLLNELYINIDTNLLALYEPSDLRKELFFAARSETGNIIFTGSYGGSLFFSGFAADEMWLIRAESFARNKDVTNAMKDLNHLLKHRYDKNLFVPKQVLNEEDALRMILEERRKELVLRATRWADIRRLNKDPRFAIAIVRYNQFGERIEIPPGSPKYVFPIPVAEIDISDIPQNPR